MKFGSRLLSVVGLSLFLIGCTEEIKENVEDVVTNEEVVAKKDVVVKDEIVNEEENNVENVIVSNNGTKPKGDLFQVDFVRVVDGDTIKVIYKGEELSVRVLMIDTPETKHPSKGVEPFGIEASNFAKEVFENSSKIELEFEGKERDHYDRLLAYVWVDGKLYNEMIVEEGLSRVGYIYGNKLYLNELNKVQDKAKESKKYIWETVGYVNESGEGYNVLDGNNESKEVVEEVEVTKSGDCTIKGNISSKGVKIYHVIGGSHYNRTDAEKMFCSAEEAQNDGFRASKN